jgi:hypothetical protein
VWSLHFCPASSTSTQFDSALQHNDHQARRTAGTWRLRARVFAFPVSFLPLKIVSFTAQATVYHALNPNDNTPLAVAIKKSRVSQRVQRSHLKHEARVLHLLQGHPAIPCVVAYGHPRHFECLAMELLGKSLDQLMSKEGMEERTVAKIAVDLVLSSFDRQESKWIEPFL